MGGRWLGGEDGVRCAKYCRSSLPTPTLLLPAQSAERGGGMSSEERIKRRVTQKKLAQLLGCSQSYVSQLEKNDNISSEIIAKVKKVLKSYPDKWAKISK